MKGTLTIFMAGILFLAAPSAYAKERRPAMCSDPMAAAMNRSACGSGSSSETRTASAAGGSGIGWSCPLKRDEYDQYRRVQNKSSQKTAETFLGSAIANLLLSAFMSTASTGTPWGFFVNLFTSGMQASNMKAQQKYACEKLELEIDFKKKQMVAIAAIGTKTTAQVKEVALNLGKQIPIVVKREFDGQKENLKIEVVREAVPLLMEELRKAGVQFKDPPPDAAPPQAPPAGIPELPERNPNRLHAPERPSVQAPAPAPVVPSVQDRNTIPAPVPATRPAPQHTVSAKPLQKQARQE